MLTANDLPSLLVHAKDSAPRELLAVHGIADSTWSGADDAAWRAHLEELAESAVQLDPEPSRLPT